MNTLPTPGSHTPNLQNSHVHEQVPVMLGHSAVILCHSGHRKPEHGFSPLHCTAPPLATSHLAGCPLLPGVSLILPPAPAQLPEAPVEPEPAGPADECPRSVHPSQSRGDPPAAFEVHHSAPSPVHIPWSHTAPCYSWATPSKLCLTLPWGLRSSPAPAQTSPPSLTPTSPEMPPSCGGL